MTFLRKCKKSVANSWEHETGPTIVRLVRLHKSDGGLWWPITVTAKPKTSWQKQKHHGKTKNLTAKTKYLTAKPNTSQQKQNSFVLPWVFAFALRYRYLVFAVNYLVLPWGFWFCREVFCFCCEVFGFAVRFLFLPRGFRFCRKVFCFCHEVFGFAVTVMGHRSGQNTVSTILQLFYRLQYITKWPESYFNNLFTFFLEKRWFLFFFIWECCSKN